MLGLLFLSALIVAVCLAPFFWFLLQVRSRHPKKGMMMPLTV